MSNSKFHGVQTSPTECTIHWTAGDCPTQDECRDYLNATGRGHLKPVLSFELGKVATPIGPSLMHQKYVKGDGNLNDDIFGMGVTAVYAWYIFDRYRVTHCASLSADYDCTFLYTTYDVNTNYQNQSPGFAKAFPEIAAQEERVWEILRDKIEAWLAKAFQEERGGYYSCRSVDAYTGDQREDLWPENVPYEEGMTTDEREACYKEKFNELLEHEQCNPRKG